MTIIVLFEENINNENRLDKGLELYTASYGVRILDEWKSFADKWVYAKNEFKQGWLVRGSVMTHLDIQEG
jgi:hypothetical protein